MSIETYDGAAGRPYGRWTRFLRGLSRFENGAVARWAFRALVVAAICVLASDLTRFVDWPNVGGGARTVTVVPRETVLTTASPMAPARLPAARADPRRGIGADDASLRQPISFTLRPDGILMAEGSIVQGAAERLAARLDALGGRVGTISLDSPGGSLDDAMAMARTIRRRGIATRVDSGALCASSCPLLMAGGATRSAGAAAVIGVHQFFADGNAPDDPEQAMADAQITTARITRHLSDMGVDPAIWLHALDTPPDALYYLTRQQLERYNLVDQAAGRLAGEETAFADGASQTRSRPSVLAR